MSKTKKEDAKYLEQEEYDKENHSFSMEEFYDFYNECTANIKKSKTSKVTFDEYRKMWSILNKKEIYDLVRDIDINGSKIKIDSSFGNMTGDIYFLITLPVDKTKIYVSVMHPYEGVNFTLVSGNKKASIDIKTLDNNLLSVKGYFLEEAEDGIYSYNFNLNDRQKIQNSKIDFIPNCYCKETAKTFNESIDKTKKAMLFGFMPLTYGNSYGRKQIYLKDIFVPNECLQYPMTMINEIYRKGLPKLYGDGKIMLSQEKLQQLENDFVAKEVADERKQIKEVEKNRIEKEYLKQQNKICEEIMKLKEINPNLTIEEHIELLIDSIVKKSNSNNEEESNKFRVLH